MLLCNQDSKTSREWETNRDTLLNASYAIRHTNESFKNRSVKIFFVSCKSNKIHLYFGAGHAISDLCASQAAKTLKQAWKWAEVDGNFWHGVTYPVVDSSPCECRTGMALLSSVWTDFGLLPYACNNQMQMNVQTGIVYRWSWLK